MSIQKMALVSALLLLGAGELQGRPLELLVQFRQGVSIGEAQEFARRWGGVHERRSFGGRFDLIAWDAQALDGARLEQLRRQPQVLAVAVNSAGQAASAPNDVYYGFQWNFRQIQMDQLWSVSDAKGQGVVVAVLDTGVAFENYGSYARAPELASGSFVPGYDFVHGTSHPNDDNGHGTHISSILIQKTQNLAGAAGMASGARVMPIKVLDAEGYGTMAWLIEGIDYAVAHGAQVINMSLTFPPGIPSNSLLDQSLKDAFDAGVVLVGATGNDNLPAVGLPAANNHVIAVGASDSSGGRAAYSNYGDALDVLAPGGDLEDRDYNGFPDAILQMACSSEHPSEFHHYFGAGTSQAAAHVSAAAAILLTRVGASDRPLKIRALLQGQASGAGAWSSGTGYGLIRVANAWVAPVSVAQLSDWQGYVAPEAQSGSGFALLYSHPQAGLLLLLETPSDGLYGVVEQAGGQEIAVFSIPGWNFKDVYANGVAGFLEMAGGLENLMASGSLAYLPVHDGLWDLVDPSTSLQGLLQQFGSSSQEVSLLFFDPSGQTIVHIDQLGGLHSLLQGGELLSSFQSNGGLVGMMEDTGAMMGVMNGTGELTEFFHPSGAPISQVGGLALPGILGNLLNGVSGLLNLFLP